VQEDNAPGHKGYAKACRGLNGMETPEGLAESPDQPNRGFAGEM